MSGGVVSKEKRTPLCVCVCVSVMCRAIAYMMASSRR